MNKRDLLILGMLSLSVVAVSGCAQKMAKNDTVPAETASGATDSSQAATPSSLPNPMADASSTAAPDTTKVADAKDATPTASAEAKTAKDAAATKQAAVLLPLPPQEITSTIKKLTNHPRVRYLSRSAQYDYYVGGRLDAKYDVNSDQLVVTNAGDNNGTPVKCEYSKDGKMIGEDKSMPQKVVGECNTLVNELGKYLAR